MKSRREQIRKELEAGMAVFLSQGNVVTKVEAVKTRVKRQPKQEKTVEIEVDYLPKALRLKHFGE